MKYSNVAAFIALLAIGACGAGRTEQSVCRIANAVAAKFIDNPFADLGQVFTYHREDTLTGEEIIALRELTADEIKNVQRIKGVLNEVNEKLDAKIKLIFDAYNSDDFEGRLMALECESEDDDLRRTALLFISKHFAPLTKDSIEVVLTFTKKSLDGTIADFIAMENRLLPIEKLDVTVKEMKEMDLEALKTLLTVGEIKNLKNLTDMDDFKVETVFARHLFESHVEKRERESEGIAIVKYALREARATIATLKAEYFLSEFQINALANLLGDSDNNSDMDLKIREILSPNLQEL